MNEQEAAAILFSLNVHEQQLCKKKKKQSKIYTGIDSKGFIDTLCLKKPKKSNLNYNDREETLTKPKHIKRNKKTQKIKYTLVNAELKEQKELNIFTV
ncbi:MAG: hypothetical protein WJU30_00552 [Candidatus Phytoplasma pruni]